MELQVGTSKSENGYLNSYDGVCLKTYAQDENIESFGKWKANHLEMSNTFQTESQKLLHTNHPTKLLVIQSDSPTILNVLVYQSYEGNHYNLVIVYDYSSKAYIVLNKHTKKVEESLNVTFDETPPPSKTSALVDDDLDEEKAIKVIERKNLENDIVDETLEIDEIVNIKEYRNHPLENIIGNLSKNP
nr:P-loop containing nucleoside triphosphate hydrolases superfamily protein [Tanacetum cinerariifolium]